MLKNAKKISILSQFVNMYTDIFDYKNSMILGANRRFFYNNALLISVSLGKTAQHLHDARFTQRYCLNRRQTTRVCGFCS